MIRSSATNVPENNHVASYQSKHAVTNVSLYGQNLFNLACLDHARLPLMPLQTGHSRKEIFDIAMT